MSLSDYEEIKGTSLVYKRLYVKEAVKELKDDLSNPDFFSPATIKTIEEFINVRFGEKLI